MKKIIVSLLVLLFLTTPVQVYAQLPAPEPAITISNVTSVSFTVSWYTDDRTEQLIIYGTDEPLSTWAVDDRGVGFQSLTHHITIRNLKPDTEYSFRINNQGTTYKQKTAPNLPGVLPPLPQGFSGRVITEDDTAPDESVIYMRINDAGLLSTVSKPDGSWYLSTSAVRTPDLSSYFAMNDTHYVRLYARSGYQGDAFTQLFAFARQNPINFHLEEARIPFYKIQLPDGILSATNSTAAAQTPISDDVQTPQRQIGPSDSGILDIIWGRVRELF